MDLMLENVDEKKAAQLKRNLTGPYRTMGSKIKPEDADAPAWWHGDEEAFESTQAAMLTLPQRRRR